MTEAGYGIFEVNRAIIEKGGERQLVYYWFEQRGKRIINDVEAKISVVWDGLTMSRTDGAIVRFVTPVNTRAEGHNVESRLETFMLDLLPQIRKSLPE